MVCRCERSGFPQRAPAERHGFDGIAHGRRIVRGQRQPEAKQQHQREQRDTRAEHINAALEGRWDELRPPFLERRSCHHAVLQAEHREQTEIDGDGRPRRTGRRRIQCGRDADAHYPPHEVEQRYEEREVGQDSEKKRRDSVKHCVTPLELLEVTRVACGARSALHVLRPAAQFRWRPRRSRLRFACSARCRHGTPGA